MSRTRLYFMVAFLGMLSIAGLSSSRASASVLSDIPIQVGVALGMSAENAAFMLSGAILACMSIMLAMVGKKFNMLTLAVPDIAVCGFLVAINWLPYWILLVLGALIAIMFGNKIRDVMT
jgi:hypothetical protein